MQGATSLASIGEYAFYGCSALTVAALPQSLTSMGYATFSMCNNLVALKIPFVGATPNDSVRSHFGYIFGASRSAIQGQATPTSLKWVYVYGDSDLSSTSLENLEGITFFVNSSFDGESDCEVFDNGNFALVELNFNGQLGGIYGGTNGLQVSSAQLANVAIPENFTLIGWDVNGDGASDQLPEKLNKGCYVWSAVTTLKNPIITFKNYDGSLLAQSEYAYGDIVTAVVASRPSDGQYDYTFVGWDKSVTLAIADSVYTAVYQKTLSKITIKFYDADGSLADEQQVEYGSLPTPPTLSDQAIDDVYYNKFVGWDKDIVVVQGEMSYTAVYQKALVEYTISFAYDDGQVFATATYHYGDSVVAPSTQRESDSVYCYEFTSWQTPFASVTQNTTYIAQYAKTFVSYTITFLDSNGNLVERSTYHYSQMPTPPQMADYDEGELTYVFVGWDKQVVAVDGDCTYTAVYKEDDHKVTIRFIVDGKVVSEEKYAIGDEVVAPQDPIKTVDSKAYYYEFVGWGDIATAQKDCDYIAQFSRKFYVYTVTFLDSDGSVIAQNTYNYGEALATPQNPADKGGEGDVCSYSFVGWDSQVTAKVEGDCTYTATYEGVAHSYVAQTIEPTCQSEGYTTYTCSVCGASYQGDVTAKLDHTPSEWIVDEQPQVGKDGSQHKQCLVCGEVLERQTLPSLTDST
jgi:hypothetical protein